MKKCAVSLFIILLVITFAGTVAFADEVEAMSNVSLGDNQEVLFEFSESPLGWPSDIHDLGYDKLHGQLYIILNPSAVGGDIASQYVVDLGDKKVVEPKYPLLEGMKRVGIEFDENQVWSLDRTGNESFVQLNDFERTPLVLSATVEAKGFAVRGETVIYYLGCGDEEANFLPGSTGLIVNPDSDEQEYEVDFAHPVFSSLDYIKGYDLSPDGEKLIYAGTEKYEKDGEEYERNYLVQVDLTGERSERRDLISDFPVNQIDNDSFYSDVYDLYAAEDCIVVLYKNAGEFKGYIERFSYEGEPIDRVETNYCVRRMTEGPNGSTLYVQRRYAEGEVEGALEVVQVNWEDHKASSPSNRPRPLVQERTRAGETIAQFGNHRFGLLRQFNPETNDYDYRIPIRSRENRVRLQIPYEDVKLKLLNGEHNVIIEYLNKPVTLSFDLNELGLALESLPSQNNSKLELIIMGIDENGNVITGVDVLTQEWRDASTSCIYRSHL